MSSPPDSTRSVLCDRRVLIVEDDRLNARILNSILQPEGCVITTVHSGEEAIESYEAFKPDVVLMDVMMPGISGIETCRRLRDQHGAELAPVIFITAKSASDDVVAGLEAGGVDYLPKPFKPREALARLRTHVHNRLLREQQRTLVADLSTANTAKNRLLGMVAHDLRNPLASIRGLTDFLVDGTVGPLSPDQLDLIRTIQETSQSMLAMVNELLDLSVIESGELKIQPEPRPIAELLAKSVYLNNINAAKKGSRIEVEKASDAVLRIDADKVKQVVDNLLSNAIKFSPPNSTIRVRADRNPDHYAVEVRDQGPGIPADERHKLFKDFSQTSVKPTAGEKSTGLGLAICRRIMESHGGTIAAESAPEGGALFRLTFPLAA